MGLLIMDMDILPPSDDRVFKLILTASESKPVLIDLITAVTGRTVVDVIVRNNELPPGDTEEKAERLDINCSINDGTQIDIEMQANRIQEESDGGHRNLKGKSVYYLCDLHSSQPSKGVRRYDRLVSTYQVTFCSYTVFPDSERFIHSFSMREDETGELLSDAVKAIFIELSKLDGIMKKPVSDMTDIEKWAVFLQYASDTSKREKVNQVIESKEALKMAGDMLMSISQDERERAVFRSRRMYQTDMESNLATAEDRGEQRGRRIGEQRGRRIGEHNTQIKVAQKMIARGNSKEDIAELTELTEEEIEKLFSENQCAENGIN